MSIRVETITGIIGVSTVLDNINGNISNSGVVLSGVGDLFIISISSLISDNWNLTSLVVDNWSVFSLINSVVSGLRFGSVLSLVLSPVEGLEDGVVTSLSFLSVKDVVFVSESNFWFISVVSDGVWSLEDDNFSSVSVFFFLSIENIVVGFIGGVWNILVFGLCVVSKDSAGFEAMSIIVVWSVGDLVVLGVSNFLIFPVLCFGLGVGRGVRYLSVSHLGLGFVTDSVFSLLVDDINISE